MAKHQDKEREPCPYCTREMVLGDLKLKPTSDHIKPKSRYGMLKGGVRNGRTIVVCSECNFMKADLTLEQFLQYLELKNSQLLLAVATNTERIMNIKYLLQIGLEE